MTEAEIKEFLTSAPRGEAELETIEISHSEFTQTYRLVRNKSDGLVAGGMTFQYCPFIYKAPDSKGDLDQVIQLTLADLNQTIAAEIENVSNTNEEDPLLIYRSYRSSNSELVEGPLTLKITGINFIKQGANITAEARSFNVSPTGELYTYDRFSMLRGFI